MMQPKKKKMFLFFIDILHFVIILIFNFSHIVFFSSLNILIISALKSFFLPKSVFYWLQFFFLTMSLFPVSLKTGYNRYYIVAIQKTDCRLDLVH